MTSTTRPTGPKTPSRSSAPSTASSTWTRPTCRWRRRNPPSADGGLLRPGDRGAGLRPDLHRGHRAQRLYAKLHAWVQADGHDDMDLFVTVKKADAYGEFVPWSVLNEPHPGVWGKMRVSHRALDPKLSTRFNPVQAHTREEKLEPGRDRAGGHRVRGQLADLARGRTAAAGDRRPVPARRMVRATDLGDRQPRAAT